LLAGAWLDEGRERSLGRLHGEWFPCHRQTTPTDLRFKANEASLSMALLTPRQNPPSQAMPDVSAQGTRLTPENRAWVIGIPRTGLKMAKPVRDSLGPLLLHHGCDQSLAELVLEGKT